MRAKKVISVSFLLLANVILLAHAILFHHHDDDDAQHVGQCHASHCHGSIEGCTLSILYVSIDNNQPTVQLLNSYFDLWPTFFSPLSDYSTPPIADDVGLPFRQKPFLISYHSDYLSQSLGLRAPPAC